MTFTVRWFHWAGLAVFALAAILGVWIAIKQAQQRSVTDWERQQMIEGLRRELDQAKLEIDRLGDEADSFRKQRDEGHQALLDARAKLKALEAIPEPTPVDKEALCQSCMAYVGLLEESLRLADLESMTLRKELSLTEMALVDAEEMFALQTKRLAAASKDKRKIRRRNIWTMVSVSAASLTLGFGMGRL